MFGSIAEIRQGKRLLEAATNDGDPNRFYEEVWEELESMDTPALNREIGRISMRRLFEEMVDDGVEYMRLYQDHRRTHMGAPMLQESQGAVDTSAFSNIIGQITFSHVLDTIESPAFVGMSLHDTVSTDTGMEELIPGISAIGDVAEEVGEDEDYPTFGVSESFIQTPRKPKRGFVVKLTEEAIWEDKTGLLMKRVNAGATSMAINLEKESLDNALGLTTSYRRNGGAAQATYANTHTQGDFDNVSAATSLVDWTDIDTVMRIFDGMTDPETGEPLLIGGALQLVVPPALRATAWRLVNATEVRQGAISATVPVGITGNPLNALQANGINIEVVSNQYVRDRTSSDSTWFLGAFKQAFKYSEAWPVQSFTQDRNSDAGFSRDVITQLKWRRKGVPYVEEPRYVVQATA